jgi:hypothetical protein
MASPCFVFGATTQTNVIDVGLGRLDLGKGLDLISVRQGRRDLELLSFACSSPPKRMPRHILPKNPLLRVYPGITLTDGYLSCPTNFYVPADWNRPDHEKPRRGRYHIWTVENGRFDGIHVDA